MLLLTQAHSPTKSERDSAVLEGLVQARDGGEAIPPVVARIFSGDSTSPLTREARTWCGARDSAGLGGLVRIGNNPSGSRPNFFGRQHLTFDKGGKNMVRG